jgi:hypothetical protein
MMVGADRVAQRNPPRDATAAAPGSQAEEAFAHSLRDKSHAGEDADAGDDSGGNDGTGNGTSQAFALTCPIAALPGLSELSPALGATESSDAPAAGIEAEGSAAAASAAAETARWMLAPTPDADATAWEASIPDGSGVAIELRAEAVPPGPGESVAWSVAVASPTLAAEMLARNAPELTNRLRRRGIASHVRIEGAFKDPNGGSNR